MWPWRKKNKAESHPRVLSAVISEEASATAELDTTPPPPPTPEAHGFNKDQIVEAIEVLFDGSAKFQIVYAQMGGYDEKVTVSYRLAELNSLAVDPPVFSDDGIDFACKNLAEDITVFARNINGLHSREEIFMRIPAHRAQVAEEDSKRWARELMSKILYKGRGHLETGFQMIGFDFRGEVIELVKRKRMADIDAVYAEIDRRQDQLRPLLLRAIARGKDKYGEQSYQGLWDECYDFFERFFPTGHLGFFYLTPPAKLLFDRALRWQREASSDVSIPQDGIDFEHWCSDRIAEQGWSTVVSQAAGDQGVDIIASRDGISVAVQCKRYTMPVGNKAVQEAYAGAMHYNASVAVVIATAGFTRAAIELAQSTNVILLDAEMIGDFTEQVSDTL